MTAVMTALAAVVMVMMTSKHVCSFDAVSLYRNDRYIETDRGQELFRYI
jgi:hypothetical protein